MSTAQALQKVKHDARKAGFDLFVIPTDGPSAGMAWADQDHHYINLRQCADPLMSARTLAHEIAHHSLGHTRHWTSAPTWQIEYEAEVSALEIVSPYVTEAQASTLEQAAKDYIRPLVQRYIDCGILEHGEYDVGVWAGCKMDCGLR